MLGRRVGSRTTPARIVSLAPSITETVFALGDGDRLVGVTDYCDYPPEATRKPRVGGISTPNFEAILGAPARPGHRHLGEQLRGARRAARVARACPSTSVRPVDWETVLESIERIGGVLGREALARAQRGRDAARRGRHRARGRAARHGPRVLYVVWPNPLIAPGRGTLINELIRRAGGESVTSAEPLPYPRLSLETVVERRPDRIIVGPSRAGDRGGARSAAGSGSARSPPCAEGRVLGVDGDLVHRPGPRMVEALRALARVDPPGAGAVISRRRVGGGVARCAGVVSRSPDSIGLATGPAPISPGDVAAARCGTGAVGAARRPCVLELRLPRVLLAALAGGGLAVAGDRIPGADAQPARGPRGAGRGRRRGAGRRAGTPLGISRARSRARWGSRRWPSRAR